MNPNRIILISIVLFAYTNVCLAILPRFGGNGLTLYVNGSKTGQKCLTYDECRNLLCKFNKTYDDVVVNIHSSANPCSNLLHNDNRDLRAVFSFMQHNQKIYDLFASSMSEVSMMLCIAGRDTIYYVPPIVKFANWGCI